jgi:hypothetical protein
VLNVLILTTVAQKTFYVENVAGTPGGSGFSGDGGQATGAKLSFPYSIWINSAKIMYIGDKANRRVRKVDTSGIISTYANNPDSTGDLSFLKSNEFNNFVSS